MASAPHMAGRRKAKKTGATSESIKAMIIESKPSPMPVKKEPQFN